MVVSSPVLEPSTSSRGSTKGAEIRAKIAANRAKRLRIADAMKHEAGVTEHTVHKEDFGGLAYIGTGRIYSPEGRKIVTRWRTNAGTSSCTTQVLATRSRGHVKEFEAESYAHQLSPTKQRTSADNGKTVLGTQI